MPKDKANKKNKVSRKRKKTSNISTDQAVADNQSTAGSSSKQDDETGEAIKPPKQLKIEEPTKVQGTDEDSFETGTTDDSDLPSYSRTRNLNEPVIGDDAIKLEESVKPESPNKNTSNEMKMVKSETEVPIGPKESNIDNSTPDVSKKQLAEAGELKLADSTTSSQEKSEKEQKITESAGKFETELDTDASSTITCSSKGRGCSETGSDKESSDSEGSKGVSSSSGNKDSESGGSVYSYPASDESGPSSVASVVSSIHPLEIRDSHYADQENTSESQGEENVQKNNPNVAVPAFMLKKYKEFSSSSSGTDNKSEEA